MRRSISRTCCMSGAIAWCSYRSVWSHIAARLAAAQPPPLLDQASRQALVLVAVRSSGRTLPIVCRGCSRAALRRARGRHEAAMIDDRAAALAQLHATVDACRKCAIGSTRTKVVCGVGNPHSALVIVGEGPGENEDRQGEPFVGRAGELLTRMLAAIDLRREDVFITNTIKCRASAESGGRIVNRAPMQDEMSNCREYLDRE